MPNSTATTISVRPGQTSAARPVSSVMIPNARTHPQARPTRAIMSAGSPLMPRMSVCIAAPPKRSGPASGDIYPVPRTPTRTAGKQPAAGVMGSAEDGAVAVHGLQGADRDHVGKHGGAAVGHERQRQPGHPHDADRHAD